MRPIVLAVLLAAPLTAGADDLLAKGRRLLDEGKLAEAVDALRRDVDAWPEHADAYRLLGLAYEKLGKKEDALQAWKDFRALAKSAEDRALADEHMGVTARPPAEDGPPTIQKEEEAEFTSASAEWFQKETAHFTVRSHNRRLTDLVAGQAEYFLARLSKTFMGNAQYPHHVPLTIYRDPQEYVAAGNPDWSQGGTAVGYESLDAFLMSRMERKIDLLHTIRGALNPDLARPRLLPHELTHLVLAEHFGEARVPLWLNEGIAQFMEKGRRDEADSIIAQADAVGGTIPLSILIDLAGYPTDRGAIELFYHQSASFTAWLITTAGEDRFLVFLKDLKKRVKAADALKTLLKGSDTSWLVTAQAAWLKEVATRTRGK